MKKIKTVKIKNEDGSIEEESYFLSTDANIVNMENGYSVEDTIGNINIDTDGNIASQLDNLNNNVNDLNNNINNLNNNIKKKIYYFNTVADMKTANLQAGDTCQTLGYYEANDGGAGLYKIREKEDNYVIDNMYLIQMKELIAELISNPITPEKLGAYGDGIHDDSYILNTFFSKIKDGEHIFLSGNYGLSFPVLLPKGYGISINGGSFTALSNFDTSVNNALLYMPSTTIEQPDGYGIYATGLRLTNISFFCNWITDGIQFPRSLNLTIDNCIFLYYKDYGINVSTVYNHDLIISNCQFRGNGYGELEIANPSNIGIRLMCPDSIIKSCVFAYGHGGMYVDKGANLIENCHFYSYQNNGYNLKIGSYDNLVQGCYFDGGSLWLSSAWRNKFVNSLISINNSTQYLIKVSSESGTQAQFWIDSLLINDQRSNTTTPINLITYDNINNFDGSTIKNVKVLNASGIILNNPFNDISINDILPNFKGLTKYVAPINISTGEMGTRTLIDGSTQYYKATSSGNVLESNFIGTDTFFQFLIVPFLVTERTRVKAEINTTSQTRVYFYDSEFNYLGHTKITIEKGSYYVALYKTVTECNLIN